MVAKSKLGRMWKLWMDRQSWYSADDCALFGANLAEHYPEYLTSSITSRSREKYTTFQKQISSNSRVLPLFWKQLEGSWCRCISRQNHYLPTCLLQGSYFMNEITVILPSMLLNRLLTPATTGIYSQHMVDRSLDSVGQCPGIMDSLQLARRRGHPMELPTYLDLCILLLTFKIANPYEYI